MIDPVETENFSVVVAIREAHYSGETSTVYCLELGRDNFEKQVRVKGSPFRLHDRNGLFIWKNDRLRAENIHDGSILSFSPDHFYGRNTGERMVSVRLYD